MASMVLLWRAELGSVTLSSGLGGGVPARVCDGDPGLRNCAEAR